MLKNTVKLLTILRNMIPYIGVIIFVDRLGIFLENISVLNAILVILSIIITFIVYFAFHHSIISIIKSKFKLLYSCRVEEYIKEMELLFPIHDEEINYHAKCYLANGYYYLGKFDRAKEILQEIDKLYMNKTNSLYYIYHNVLIKIAKAEKDYEMVEKVCNKLQKRFTDPRSIFYKIATKFVELSLLKSNNKDVENLKLIKSIRENDLMNEEKVLNKVVYYYNLLSIYEALKETEKYEEAINYILQNGGDTYFVKEVKSLKRGKSNGNKNGSLHNKRNSK